MALFGRDKGNKDRKIGIRTDKKEEKKLEVCANCGIRGKMKAQCNGKGKFIRCKNLLCNECAEKCKLCSKYFCNEHLYNHICADAIPVEEGWQCFYCKQEFGLKPINEKKLKRFGQIVVKCPYCVKRIRCVAQKESEQLWECPFCSEEFMLGKKQSREFEKYSNLVVYCPSCRKKFNISK